MAWDEKKLKKAWHGEGGEDMKLLSKLPRQRADAGALVQVIGKAPQVPA